ncbi:MAG TPA: hypothetical protein VFB33_15620 [Candidatus Binataceae bacterium]|jgi:hypothetical protein|nr:hypothetical protein [Candidatus Binataceae bacterium]
MRQRLTGIVRIAAIAAIGFAVAGGATRARAAKPHQHIYNAYHKLRRAHYVISHGCTHLGGHREAAMRQVEAANGELKLAMASVHGTLPTTPEGGPIRVVAGQVHPYMIDALRECREAKAALASAAHDFGGHRVKAIQHIDIAIAELQEAIKEPACKK